MGRLGALLVDVGGTIWSERSPIYSAEYRIRRFHRLFPELSNTQIEALVEALDAPTRRWESPAIVEQDSDVLIADVLEKHGFEHLSRELVRNAMYVPASEGGHLFEDVPLLLRRARELGLRTVVVSNAAWRRAEDYRRDFEHFGVGDLIYDVVTSLDVGYRKPHDRIFRAATEAAGYPDDRCVFVGDSEEKDVAGAKQRGMRTILVAIEQPTPLTTQADAVARSLSDVADIIARWVKSDAPEG